MESSDKLVRAVAELNRLTQQGECSWEMDKPPEGLDFFAKTKYLGKNIAIVLEKYFVDVPEEDPLLLPLKYQKTRREQRKRYALVFFDEDREVELLRFHSISGLDDLADSIRRQVSGADAFFDNLLALDSE